MKILTCIKPGHLEYGFADLPELLPGNALLKIKRVGICGTDLHAFEGTQPYFSYPRILGHELAGELIDTGGAEGLKKAKRLPLSPTTTAGTASPAVRKTKLLYQHTGLRCSYRRRHGRIYAGTNTLAGKRRRIGF
jgi:threonine dehydrogenase-like Zn-dependent dehydrogenase